jgi:hypothetical protein
MWLSRRCVSRSISTSWVSHAALHACWRTRSAVARDVHADIGSVRRRIGQRIVRRSRWASHRPSLRPPTKTLAIGGLLRCRFDCDRSSPRASDRRAIHTGNTWVRQQPGDPALRTTTRSNARRRGTLLHCADGFRRRVGRSTASNDRARRARNQIGRPVGAFDATARTCARRARVERFAGSW